MPTQEENKPSQEEIEIMLKDFKKKIQLRFANQTSRIMFFVMENLVDCIGDPTEGDKEFVEQYRVLSKFLEEKEKQQAEQIIEEMLLKNKSELEGKSTQKELLQLNKDILNTKTSIRR